MLDSPHKFKHLDKMLSALEDKEPGSPKKMKNNQLRMNLPGEDLNKYLSLQEEIKQNNQKKLVFKEKRKKILEEAKCKSIQPPRKIISKLSVEN